MGLMNYTSTRLQVLLSDNIGGIPMESRNSCRVCGYNLPEPPWDESKEFPSWQICSSCGAEAGIDDCDLESIRQYRHGWLLEDCPWFDPELMPVDWTWDCQKKQIPAEWK